MTTNDAASPFKSGFAALIGRPSAGKSTLINAICGFKVSIVSPQPQTTRFTIRGIYTEELLQVIFIDTPGYHHFNSFLNKELSEVAAATLDDGDIVLYVVDLTRPFGEEEEAILSLVTPHQKRLAIVFNKADGLDAPETTENFREIRKRLPKVPYMIISALEQKGLRELLDMIAQLLPEGPLYYPEEYVTDQSIPFRIEEVVREKIFEFTKEEIPHSVYVKVDDLDIGKNTIKAYATIFTDRNSQKGILVGKGGETIKNIGIAARATLEEIFEKKINLFLNVKVHDNWKKNEKFIKKLFNIDDR